MENKDNKIAPRHPKESPYVVSIIVTIAGAIILSSLITSGEDSSAPAVISVLRKSQSSLGVSNSTVVISDENVLPPDGVVLPVVWGDLGQRLVESGTIDREKFISLYEKRGQFTDEEKNLLLGRNDGKLKITRENSGYLLNLFWALGLGNKNPVLDSGEMSNPVYGGAESFASTGGWTIAKGDPMDHYSRHRFITLTPEQQALVEKVSKGIYRPCCGNSTHFPDCNHGMAMLGFLELMASQGVSEQDMWRAALTLNSYWFPNNYLTIASYMKNKGVDWKDVNPQEILGVDYSSSRGYAKIAAQVVAPKKQSGGSGCGVDAEGPATPQPQGSGCGVDAGEAVQPQQAGCGI